MNITNTNKMSKIEFRQALDKAAINLVQYSGNDSIYQHLDDEHIFTIFVSEGGLYSNDKIFIVHNYKYTIEKTFCTYHFRGYKDALMNIKDFITKTINSIERRHL